MELTSSNRRLARTFTARRAFPAVLVAGLLSFSASAWAQIAAVHVTQCGSATFPSTPCAIPATGTGNLIVVGWASVFGTTPTVTAVTDNAGNVYTEAGNARAVDAAANQIVDLWYAKNSKPGATSLTVTPSASGTGAAVIWEFSNVDTAAPLDQTVTLNSQAATTTPFGGVTTTSPNTVIISVMTPGAAPTGLHAGNPFTSDGLLFGLGWAHLLTSSPGTYTAQWDTALGTYASSTVSFKGASGAGALNACDLAPPFGTVNSSDVDAAVNMTLGVSACSANVIGPGVCNVVVVQRVVNAIGGACVTGSGGVTPGVSTLSCIPGSLTGPGTSACLVALSAPAPSGGFVVTLASGNTKVTVPSSLTVPAGASTASFNATASSVTSNQTAVLTANGAGTTQAFTLTVTAPASVVTHSVSLTWAASTSAGVVGYNIYRGTTSGGPYTKLTPSPVSGIAYTDNAVTSGATYYYVATSVDVSGNESGYSAQAPAAIIPNP